MRGKKGRRKRGTDTEIIIAGESLVDLNVVPWLKWLKKKKSFKYLSTVVDAVHGRETADKTKKLRKTLTKNKLSLVTDAGTQRQTWPLRGDRLSRNPPAHK